MVQIMKSAIRLSEVAVGRLIIFGARVCESRGFGIALTAYILLLHAAMALYVVVGVWQLHEGETMEGVVLIGVGLFWISLIIGTKLLARRARRPRKQ